MVRTPSTPPPLVATLSDQVATLRGTVVSTARALLKRWQPILGPGNPFRASAENLAAYLALRNQEIRTLQDDLSHLGLSSLGRCESRVAASLAAVEAALHAIGQHGQTRARVPAPEWPAVDAFHAGFERIQSRADALLGAASPSKVRIMVTLPAEAATAPEWSRRLIAAGVSCVRINCAHDSPPVWLDMIRNVRDAATSLGRDLKVQMDLTGPRARTTEVRLREPETRVHMGDRIFLAQRALPARPAAPFEAVCSLSEVIKGLRVDSHVFFNEGKLGTRVIRVTPAGALLEVVQARIKGERFRDDMGVNTPDSELHLDPLTRRDRRHLDFVVQHADIVGYSFVQSSDDMDNLHREIAKRVRLRRLPQPLAIVAKIETARAVRNLPDIIVHGAASAPLAVMIARGDLAVELGPVRMAEIQEELLWLCEAAHVPVIWATQVLESLAKKGLPSRAELTDAAMSERAECVMLNKGPYIVDAVRLLDEVLSRMAAHQRKKMPTFRQLLSWSYLMPPKPAKAARKKLSTPRLPSRKPPARR